MRGSSTVQMQAAKSACGFVSLVALLLLDVALVVDATPTPLPTKPAPLTTQPISVTPVPETKVPPPLPPTMSPTNSTSQPTAPPIPAPTSEPACNLHDSCSLCTLTYGCGWNADVQLCELGDSMGPRQGESRSWVPTYDGCQCLAIGYCMACTANAYPSCGWQPNTQTCFIGNQQGPSPSSNAEPDWEWNWLQNQCSGYCSDSVSCDTCTDKSICGWEDGFFCAFGNSTGPRSGSATSWHFFICPTSTNSPVGYVSSSPIGAGTVFGIVCLALVFCGMCLTGCAKCIHRRKAAANRAQAASLLQAHRVTQAARITGAAAVPVTMGGALPPGAGGTAAAAGTTSGYYGTLTSDHLEPEVEPPAVEPSNESLSEDR